MRNTSSVPFFYRFLSKSKTDKYAELLQLSEFGKSSVGLFHDVLNPLTSIILYLESLSKEHITNHNNLLKNITESSKKLEEMLVLIKKLNTEQNYNKLFTAQKEIENVVKLASYKIIKNNINLEILSERDEEVFGNPVKFQQIILNILQNALDACITSTKTKKTVQIKIFKKDTFLNISIEDNGDGISEKNIKNIFKPFFTTKKDGNGIGLTSVKKIIEKDFYGQILVESSLESGTKFTLKFPINIKNFHLD